MRYYNDYQEQCEIQRPVHCSFTSDFKCKDCGKRLKNESSIYCKDCLKK